ncbi:hypothetical protein M9H77_31472 [Catharanthus roseus]|uniref:Uncharacterized protein n=1 Tax=Catharanthus roseus TaxID=4058 RepID=A0ACC0A173_CATRO|nr:hypothetical protein M9H77_31472 [Catharanthus roseus]
MLSRHYSFQCRGTHIKEVKSKFLGSLPEYVKIVEVGPIDGSQNEKGIFVSPKWLANAKDVLKEIQSIKSASFPYDRVECRNLEGSIKVNFILALLRGFEAAIEAGAKKVAMFTAASKSFSRSNINCSIEDSLNRYRDVALAARKLHISNPRFNLLSISFNIPPSKWLECYTYIGF